MQSDIPSTILYYLVMQSPKGGGDFFSLLNFVNGYGISHLLVIEKSGNFIFTDEW